MDSIIRTIDISIQELYPDILLPTVTLCKPPKWNNGDYCFNIGTIGRLAGKNTREVGATIQQSLEKFPETFHLVENIGIYINLCLQDKAFLYLLEDSINIKKTPQEQGRIIIDYIGVNIGKPLHIGHICTPSIGQVFCNIYRQQGFDVIWDVHTGDWGGIFGRLIAGWKKWGSETEFQKDPVNHLLSLYQKISAEIEPESWEKNEMIDQECREEFKKLSEWDPKNIRLWSRFTKESLENMQKTIKLLHVHPDVAIGESFYEWLSLPKFWEYPDLSFTMKDVTQELIELWIAHKNMDGSVSIQFPEDSKLPSNIIQKKDGTHGYFASDLASIKYRVTNGWDPKKVIYCTDMRQQLHFQQVFAVARRAWWVSDDIQLIHAPNWFISLPEWAMSTRKWNIIRLDDLIEEAFVRTRTILEEKGRIWDKSLTESNIREIAIWAIKYSYLMQDREKNIVFDWNKALSFEGNSGPYIQYAFVRGKKLLATMDDSLKMNPSWAGIDYVLSEYDKKLIQCLIWCDNAIAEVLIRHKPHTLTSYAYGLAGVFNSFYAHTPSIIHEENIDLKIVRTHLIKTFVLRLEEVWNLLGMKMPTEM